MRKYIVFQLFLLFIVESALAQSPVLEPIYTLGTPLQRCNEPAIVFADPKAKAILAATNTKHLFWSKNGGKNYHHYLAESSLGVYGDPVLLRHNNDIFYLHLAKAPQLSWPACFDRIVVQRSSDGGKSFTDGVGVGYNGQMQDKPWASFDQHPKSPYYNRMYVSWTRFDEYQSAKPSDSSRIYLSFSQNKGDSFSEAVRVSDLAGDCLDENETVEGATTASLTDGRVVCVWAGRHQLMMDISSDGGQTWGNDTKIDTLPGGWNLNIPQYPRNNALPFVVADAQGKLTVVTCREWKQGPQVSIYESADAGQHWSATVLPALPTETHMMPIVKHEQETGITGIMYYSVTPDGTSVKLAWKKADNKVWKEITINKAPFPPPNKQTFFGDYIGLDVLGHKVQAIWTETTPTGTKVCTRRILIP
jgi:hypothetical protein